jgi:uncharacterized protein YkwD
MRVSIGRHRHPCQRGLVALAWRSISILARSSAGLGPLPARWAPPPAWGASLSAGGASLLACATLLAAPAAAKARSATRSPRPAAIACANAELQPTPTDLPAIDAATLCLVNRVRTANRLRALRFSNPLQSVASAQAREMVQGDYFGDRSLSGKTPMQRILATAYPAHATRVKAAQNIGWATGPLASPAAMVQAWMHSPPHREIILTAAFRDLGVGVTAAAPSTLSQGLAGATYTLELAQRIFSGKTARRR